MLLNNSIKCELFSNLLAQASGDTLICMLDAKARWKLCLEILLGHAPIKGGRTRDFPFSVQREKNSHLSSLLIKHKYIDFIPGSNKKKGKTFSQYDLIVALMLLEIAEEQKHAYSQIENELHYSIAIRVLINEIFPGLEKEKRIEITDLLGISYFGQDVSCSVKAYKKDNLRLAKVIAVISQETRNRSDQYSTENCKLFSLRKDDITRLQNGTVDLVISKTKKVQKMLNHCKQPFIQRGVSYWCSQVLSRTRDSIKDIQLGSSFIFADCDSVSIQIVSSSVKENLLNKAIKENFTSDEKNISESFIKKYYPRLTAYYQAAKEQCIITSSALPPIGNVVLEQCTLLQLSRDTSNQSGFLPIEFNQHLITFPTATSSNSGYPCSGIYGDESLRDNELSVPYWFNKQKDEMYGWTSTLLSLIGMTYRQATNNSISEHISKQLGRKITSNNKHKALILNKDSGNALITYIKFDGDKVGKLFSSLSTLCRPSLGMKLEILIRETLLEALCILCKEKKLNHVPIDLLYFGGDDLFIAISSELAEQFINVFDRELNSNQIKLNLKISFSFIAIYMPFNYKTNKLPDGTFIESKVLANINSLLTQIKENKQLTREIARHTLIIKKEIKGMALKGVITQLC